MQQKYCNICLDKSGIKLLELHTTPLLNELCTENCVSNVVYDNYLYSGPLSQNYAATNSTNICTYKSFIYSFCLSHSVMNADSQCFEISSKQVYGDVYTVQLAL